MAGRYLTLFSARIFAVCTATLLLVLAHGSAAYASSNQPPAGDRQDANPPEVPADQLHAPIIDHEFSAEDTTDEGVDNADAPFMPVNHMTPEAESALRKLFQDGIKERSEAPSDLETALEEDEPETIKARVPGISDGELERYKRHMYRRDI